MTSVLNKLLEVVACGLGAVAGPRLSRSLRYPSSIR